MTHHFDTDIAVKYGLNQAILFNTIAYWVHYNESNNMNLHDGRYWVYNSKAAWTKQFPYFTERQIRSALDRLKELGLIETSNFNSSKYNHTLWYTLTEKGEAEYYKEHIDWTQMSNHADAGVQSTIDNNIHNNSTTYIPQMTKVSHGEYKHVKLTSEQLTKLNEDFGEETVQRYIRLMDEYCEMHGKKYKNYNLALRKAIREKWWKDASPDTGSDLLDIPITL